MKTVRWSRNPKLEKLMLAVEAQLNELGIENVILYYETFSKNWKSNTDYNIAQYGNVLNYYDDVRDLYRECGYKWAETASDMKLWESYKRCVGYVARELVKEFHEFSNAK